MGTICSKSPESTLSVNPSKFSKPSSNSSRSRSGSCSSRGENLNIRNFYHLGRVLGSGNFGKVRKGVSNFDPSLEVAVKSIEKSRIKSPEAFMREVQMLRLMDHPNIVKIFETFEDDKAYHIVMELCSGKELLAWLGDLGTFDEETAAKLMLKVLNAVNYMHKHGVCHRDLKLENFVSCDMDDDLKLIDFGLSRRFGKVTPMMTVVGSPYYIAPEVLRGSYNQKCDLWSCGVMLFILLSGKMPFNGWDTEDLIKQICTCEVAFKGPQWEKISPLGKDLCSRLLDRNTETRLSAEEALKHGWFSQSETGPLDCEILTFLKTFNIRSVFQREALYLISRTLKYSQIKTLNQLFYSLDQQKQGFLLISDIKTCLASSCITINKSEIEACLNNLDLNKDGKINYSDFLIATLHCKFSSEKQAIQEAFNHFHRGSEKITTEDLQQVLYLNNSEVSAEVVLAELNLSNSSEISFEEFKKLVLGVTY